MAIVRAGCGVLPILAGNSIAFSFSSNGPVNFELPPVRRDLDGMPPIEERKCPVSGCDSSGHLGEFNDNVLLHCIHQSSSVSLCLNEKLPLVHFIKSEAPIGLFGQNETNDD